MFASSPTHLGWSLHDFRCAWFSRPWWTLFVHNFVELWRSGCGHSASRNGDALCIVKRTNHYCSVLFSPRWEEVWIFTGVVIRLRFTCQRFSVSLEISKTVPTVLLIQDYIAGKKGFQRVLRCVCGSCRIKQIWSQKILKKIPFI